MPVAAIPARPEDVATLDGIMRAFYDVVNVGPGEPRQWARDRTLYAPWIRFVATGTSPTTGRTEAEAWDHPQYVAKTEPLVRQGFRERELFRRTSRYGNIVHIDSTYETLLGQGAAAQASRGVNSIELYWDGSRWWIASVMWMSEDKANPIPAALLPPASP